MTHQSLSLSPHVGFADTEGDLVFLDLAANRYRAVPRRAASPVRRALAGASRPGDDPSIAEELVSAGLARWTSAPQLPKRRARPTRQLDLDDAPGHRWRDAARIGGATLEALWRYARQTPERWIDGSSGGPPLVDADDLARAVAAFECWRLLIPRSGRCLPHSLLLRAFLRRLHIPAELVFGVRTHPFEAHCWVEHDRVVLNDTLEHAGWFEPLAIASDA